MEIRFLKSKTYFLSSYKWKYNAAKIISNEAGAFGNNIEKELQKPLPKLKEYMYYIFTENICSVCSPMQEVFLEKCVNFVQQWLKFSHFEGSIRTS